MSGDGEPFVAEDMVDLLLQLADDPSLEVPIERNGVKAFALDLIGAGTDTSAVTVEWAKSELLRKPATLAKATEELDRVVGRSRLVTEEDISCLPYLEAIVKETMRLHPVGPLLAPRLCRQDAIDRDPAVWGDKAEEFWPERFIGRAMDVKGQDFELLPFGSGRRMCPGYSLGLKMVQVMLANLIYSFVWTLSDGMAAEELTMEEKFGLSMPRKVPLEAIVETRLLAHLYTAP
ncbi:hypothetical protein ACP4OV_030413 [Aristida adscensionis]